MIQEVCNALFDSLFHILPLGSEMDQIEPTRTRLGQALPWVDDAQHLLNKLVSKQPVLVQISAAKLLRDQAEECSRENGDEEVQMRHVELASQKMGMK